MVTYILVGMFAAFEAEKLRRAILSGAGALVSGKRRLSAPNTLDSTAVWRLSIDVIRPLRSSLGFVPQLFFRQSSGVCSSKVARFQLQARYGISIIKRIGASSTGGHATSPPCH